ncbi:MAG: mechanosensitive ion channel family protein, partial [Bradymonadaceae bacterium]
MNQLIDYFTEIELLGLDLWQIAAAATVIVVGIALQGLLFDRLIRPLHGAFEDTQSSLDELLIEKLHNPFNWLVRLLAVYLGLRILDLPASTVEWIDLGAATLATVFVAWMLFRGIDLMVQVLDEFTTETEAQIDDQLVPVVRRILRFCLVTVAILAIIQQWGYNVGSLLAGLGIGGLAFALAARNMLSNWFGALMIFTDRPFQIGDWVVVDDREGVVTDVTMFNTRLRTYDNEDVLIPNDEVAKSNIVNR